MAKIFQFKHEFFRQIKPVSITDLSLTQAKVYKELRYKPFFTSYLHTLFVHRYLQVFMKVWFTWDHFIKHKVEILDAIVVLISFVLDLVFLDDDTVGGVVGK